MTPARDAVLREMAEVLWEESPGHHGGALSKILVAAGEGGSRVIDYRISSYEPRAHVALHQHEAKEQIYHFLQGEGLLTLGERRVVVRKDSYVFIPPGVPHALHNTGLANLVFLVITAPVVP
ncbi:MULTISPECIES: cupin domain-containing protein [Roseomonadaceae]|uniref:Cupin domain-containing protein n=1 Tax=Falsiroseomonas oleicola TaxID=2801474 RepID=A0ABS6HFB5_9PROT|nr:cupin domain-containing protein [Roseomonas oleicola]MBU8546658.1 cupin domain-containing protein [Roseomonas oleicola]